MKNDIITTTIHYQNYGAFILYTFSTFSYLWLLKYKNKNKKKFIIYKFIIKIKFKLKMIYLMYIFKDNTQPNY
jgi:hypothetical protein